MRLKFKYCSQIIMACVSQLASGRSNSRPQVRIRSNSIVCRDQVVFQHARFGPESDRFHIELEPRDILTHINGCVGDFNKYFVCELVDCDAPPGCAIISVTITVALLVCRCCGRCYTPTQPSYAVAAHIRDGKCSDPCGRCVLCNFSGLVVSVGTQASACCVPCIIQGSCRCIRLWASCTPLPRPPIVHRRPQPKTRHGRRTSAAVAGRRAARL